MTTTKLILSRQSEVQALKERREELAALENTQAERESQLTKLRGEMAVFESRYLNIVGDRYNQLAEIEKEIAKLQGLDDGNDYDGDSPAEDEVGCGQNRFHSDKLKKLYREVARKLHPDLASCPQERQHRHQLMVEVNRAYESGAEDRLQELLEAGASLQAVETDDAMSAEMIVLLRRVADSKKQIAEIESDIEQIQASEIYRLKVRVENSEAMGIDLFADLLSQVDRQIKKANNRLFHLRLIHESEPV